MNYLAHVFLADDEPQSVIGNLMADILRHHDIAALPAGIQKGIRQHRQVDGFTDRHPVVLRSMRRLDEKWGWFTGIIIDVYYDHLLANAFEDFSDEPLRQFVDRAHDHIRAGMDDMPEEPRTLARRLIQNDRLHSYITLDGISYALTKVSERIAARLPKKGMQLQYALPELQQNHGDLMEDFQEFFPQAIKFCEPWKTTPRRDPAPVEREAPSRSFRPPLR